VAPVPIAAAILQEFRVRLKTTTSQGIRSAMFLPDPFFLLSPHRTNSISTSILRLATIAVWQPEGGQLRLPDNHSAQLRAAMTGAVAVAWLEVQTLCAEIVGISAAIHD
jgi:hypothetical protein